MANLSDVVEELKELQEVTAYSSNRIEKPLKGLENAIQSMTTSLSNQLQAMIDFDKQKGVDDKFKAEEDRENASENKKQSEKQTLQLTQVGTELKKMFGGLGSIFKTGLLAAAIPLLFGASGGPLTALLGLATGNPFLIALGALATLIDVIINGGDVFGRISEQWSSFTTKLEESHPLLSAFAAGIGDIISSIGGFAAAAPELTALGAGLALFFPAARPIIAAAAGLTYLTDKLREFSGEAEAAREVERLREENPLEVQAAEVETIEDIKNEQAFIPLQGNALYGFSDFNQKVLDNYGNLREVNLTQRQRQFRLEDGTFVTRSQLLNDLIDQQTQASQLQMRIDRGQGDPNTRAMLADLRSQITNTQNSYNYISQSIAAVDGNMNYQTAQ